MKFIKSSYRCVKGHTHKHTPAGLLSYTHSKAKHTLCNCSICLFLSPSLNLSFHFSHRFSYSHSCSHICHPTSHHTAVPCFCSCAERTWKKCTACILPNMEAFSKHSDYFGPYSNTYDQQVHLRWRACVGDHIVASSNYQSDFFAWLDTTHLMKSFQLSIF